MTNQVKVVEIDHIREKLVELIDGYTEPLTVRDIHKAEFSARFADHLIANGVTVRERDEMTVVLPRRGHTVKATFSPNDIIGTLCIGGETYQIYLSGIEAHQLGCEAESHCTTCDRIRRKFTLIEV